MGRPNVNWSVGIALDKHSTYTSKTIKAGIPFAQQVIEPNMKYIVKYDFSLGGESVEIPENCILEFDGGSISNGTIIGNNTQVYAKKVEVFSGITIDGTWAVPEITTAWFGDIEQPDVVKQAFNLCSDDCYNVLTVESGEYWVHVDDNWDGHYAIGLYSHMHLILIGTIKTFGNNYEDGKTIYAHSKSDIKITGNGSVYGDKLTHIYSDGQTHPDGYVNPQSSTVDYTQPTHEACHVIAVLRGFDITIDGIHIFNATGDGIDIFHNNDDPRNITIKNFHIENCRRNGITFGASSAIIENGYIKTVRGTNPEAGIDIEISISSVEDDHNERILVRNVKIEDVLSGFMVSTALEEGEALASVGMVEFDNIEVPDCQWAFTFTNVTKNIIVNNCRFFMHYRNAGAYAYKKNCRVRCDMATIQNSYFKYDYKDDSTTEKFPEESRGRQYLFDCSSRLDPEAFITFLNNEIDAPYHYMLYYKKSTKAIRNVIKTYGLKYPHHSYADHNSLFSANYMLLGEGGISTLRARYSDNVIAVNDGTITMYPRAVFNNNYIVFNVTKEITDERCLLNFVGNSAERPDDVPFRNEFTDNYISISSNAYTNGLKAFIYVSERATIARTIKFVGNFVQTLPDTVPVIHSGYSTGQIGNGIMLSNNLLRRGVSPSNQYVNKPLYTLPTVLYNKNVYGNSIIGIRATSRNAVYSLYESATSDTNKTITNISGTPIEFFIYGFYVYGGETISYQDTNASIDRELVVTRGVVDFSLAVNLTTELVPGKEVYLKGTYGTTTIGGTVYDTVTFDDTVYAQELPDTDDGCVYFLMGVAISDKHVRIAETQYKYRYIDDVLTLID